MMWNLGDSAAQRWTAQNERDGQRRKFFETIGLRRRIEQSTNGIQTSGGKVLAPQTDQLNRPAS